MDNKQRIEQFEKMAHDDPDNELGHLTLGKAYIEAQRYEEAAASLKRALDLNPKLSKAYELVGGALDRAGQRELAVEFLTRGVQVADQRGDRKPREAMAQMLRDFGAEVPEAPAVAVRTGPDGGGGATGDGFRCSRCGRPDGKHDKAPFKGELGQRVLDNVCKSCFREWIGMGTKVINEMSLVMADPKSQETYDQHMIEFLQLEE